MELCKLRGYDGIQGHSLKPMLSSEDVRVRDHVLVEDDIATITAKLTPIPAKTRTVITEQYRYTRNAKGEEQLFDLQADPDEMQDLTASNHPGRGQMMEVLADALLAADDAARELLNSLGSYTPISDDQILGVLQLWSFANNHKRTNVLSDGRKYVHSDTFGAVGRFNRPHPTPITMQFPHVCRAINI